MMYGGQIPLACGPDVGAERERLFGAGQVALGASFQQVLGGFEH